MRKRRADGGLRRGFQAGGGGGEWVIGAVASKGTVSGV